MNLRIERRVNGSAISEEDMFGKQKRSPQAEALLRRVMRRRENGRE